MGKKTLIAFLAIGAGLVMAPALASGPVVPLSSSLYSSDSGLHFVATRSKSRTTPYRGMSGPKARRPHCPYGKKSDGSCWVRCSQVICL
jgi:hypothetical protein